MGLDGSSGDPVSVSCVEGGTEVGREDEKTMCVGTLIGVSRVCFGRFHLPSGSGLRLGAEGLVVEAVCL